MRKKQYVRKQKELTAFGKHVRELRRKRKITMVDLAGMTELDYTQISRIEKGQINTSVSNAFLIAEALEVTYSELFAFKTK